MAPVASMSTPYRVQFGAFRRAASANELAAMLSGAAGVASEVFASPGTGVNPIVTRGGFASADAAQRWIDFERARRGWNERPVVIRSFSARADFGWVVFIVLSVFIRLARGGLAVPIWRNATLFSRLRLGTVHSDFLRSRYGAGRSGLL